MIAQILQDPEAQDYLRWLDWALWMVAGLCIGAIVLGAVLAAQPNPETGRKGRTMIVSGLVGALAAGLVGQITQWSYDLIVA